ncbi:MAG: EthD family reductase [Betaproteobacteria bacterium]|nr:EthD family reductase [Betaproteobacteria bacterium]
MTVSYFVRYDISTADAKSFLEHYRTRHVPILARWPGAKRVVLHTPAEWNDPFAITRGNAMLLVQVEFESAAALKSALFSRERAEARLDFQNFPAFSGTVTHQAMLSEEAWHA